MPERIVQERLAKILPGAMAFVSREGKTKLLELSKRLRQPFPGPGPKPTETLLRSAGALAGRVGGPEASAAIIKHLSQGLPVLASHHHGLDTHPEMVQGELIWALASILDRTNLSETGHRVCVLASSSVPLNNPTAPGGLLPGRRNQSGRRSQARLFSRSMDHAMVSRTPAASRKTVESLIARLPRLSGWTERERASARRFAERFLLEEKFLSFEKFTDQAAHLAAAAFSARFEGLQGPPLVFLELEALATSLIVSDLADKLRPASRALLDGSARSAIVSKLAGKQGAWSRELVSENPAALESRLSDGLGTVFFWTASKHGRRRPMGLASKAGRAVLKGPDFELPLAPEPLATALAEGLLIPGLFLDYLALASHGLSALGGVFMIQYLPELLEPAMGILETPLASLGREASLLGAGLLPLGFHEPSAPGGRAPAGALELMNPLDKDFLTLVSNLSVSDILGFSAGEWYQEETPAPMRLEGWEGGLGIPGAAIRLGD